MCDLLDAYAQLVAGYNDYAHPIELFMETEDDLRRLSREVCARHTPGEEMPFLGALDLRQPRRPRRPRRLWPRQRHLQL